jgi:hypothetical protein
MNITFKIGDLVKFAKPFPDDIIAPFVVNVIEGEYVSLLNRENPFASSVRHIHFTLLEIYVDDGSDVFPTIGFGKDSV